MVYSKKKILRNNLYEPCKKRQKCNDRFSCRSVPKAGKHTRDENRQLTLADVATKAASILKGIPKNYNVSNPTYWQRLPSQNLSFQSAEILTVPECIVNAAMYKNKAIRTTGIFVQQDFETENSYVFLKMRNPIQTKHPIETKQFESKVRGSASSRFHGTTSGLKKSLKPSLVHAKGKRSVVGQKISLKISRETCGRQVDSNSDILLSVAVDPKIPDLRNLVAGSSMIMVIGTLQEDGVVSARILKILDHFDTSRHMKCLHSRRRMIYNKYGNDEREAKVSAHGGRQTFPLHGCGPLPFESFA